MEHYFYQIIYSKEGPDVADMLGPFLLVGQEGVEPSTSKSEAWRSNPIELLARDQDIIGLGLDCKKIFFFQ